MEKNKTSKNTQVMDLMIKLHYYGMLEAYKQSLRTTSAEGMTPDDFLKWLLDSELDYKTNLTIDRLIRNACFRYNAYMETIDYTLRRNLDRNQLERLASLDFIKEGGNILITGCSGTGKSYIATAIGYEACRHGIRTYYSSTTKLMGRLKLAKTKGTLESDLKKIEKCPLFIMDDLFLVGLDAKERAILLDIIEDRHGRKSMILTSQLPVDSWYEAIGDDTVADAILDRIVHTAHKIELTGESIRKKKAQRVLNNIT